MRSYDLTVSADAYALLNEPDDLDKRSVDTMSLLELSILFFGEEDVDFLKMDVEGTEWELLDEWWPAHFRHVLVEFHDEPRDGPRIVARGIEALEARGFDARHHEIHPQAVWAVRR
jgi:hypothetical protein